MRKGVDMDFLPRASLTQVLKRLREFLGSWSDPFSPEDEIDPFAGRPVPRKPQPKSRSGAVAVEEPD